MGMPSDTLREGDEDVERLAVRAVNPGAGNIQGVPDAQLVDFEVIERRDASGCGTPVPALVQSRVVPRAAVVTDLDVEDVRVRRGDVSPVVQHRDLHSRRDGPVRRGITRLYDELRIDPGPGLDAERPARDRRYAVRRRLEQLSAPRLSDGQAGERRHTGDGVGILRAAQRASLRVRVRV